MLDSFNYETKELFEENCGMQYCIDSCHKSSERRNAYPEEQSTTHFNNVAKISTESNSITPNKKKMGKRKIFRKIVLSIST